jgi:hypothetical protein
MVATGLSIVVMCLLSALPMIQASITRTLQNLLQQHSASAVQFPVPEQDHPFWALLAAQIQVVSGIADDIDALVELAALRGAAVADLLRGRSETYS